MGKLELPSKPNPCDHTDIGEALRGEKIAVEAHDIDRVRYGHGLGKHKNVVYNSKARYLCCN